MYNDDFKDVFHFKWKLKNFSISDRRTGDAIDSSQFIIDVLDETKWFLSIYPRGKEEGGYVDIFVTRCTSDKGDDKISVIFTIELEAADSSHQEGRVSLESVFERGATFGFHRYIKRRTLLEDLKSTFLPDDVLTVHCKLERAPMKVEYIKEYVAETFDETIESEYEWSIENWKEIEDSKEEVYKDVHFDGDHKASLRTFVSKRDSSFHDGLMLKLKKLVVEKDTYVTCRLSILDAQSSEVLVRLTYHHFKDGFNIISDRGLLNGEDIQDSYLQNGALKVKCHLTVVTGKRNHTVTESIRESPLDENKDLEVYIQEEMIKDFENMYLNGHFCDVKVRAGRKMVACHQSILRARSSVMSDLLDKAEKTSADDCIVIDIDHLDGDTLEQMVYFMYSDKFRNKTFASALKLLMAGHTYQIKYLKERCASYLSTVLNFENVYDVVVAAHLYEDGVLKRFAISYISEHFSSICLTTEWANFRKTEREIAAYTCREIRRLKQM